jgi:hypothetical protein
MTTKDSRHGRSFFRKTEMKLQEQLFRKIKTQGKSIKTAETYWHYCEDYLLRLKHNSGDWVHPSKAGRAEIEESVKVIWRHDQTDNPNGVSLPDSYRKKAPNAARELRWYWLFPSENLSRGEEGLLCRHHRHQDHIAATIKAAADKAGIITRVTSHVLRHSYATHAHEQGVSVRTLMELLGHESIETTEIYLHADKNGATAAQSPLTQLPSSAKMQAPESERVTGPVTLKVYRGEVG